jgi:hypothetical protein
MNIKKYYIGVDGESVVSSEKTKEQIKEIFLKFCDLINEETKKKLSWNDFYNDDDRSLFKYILNDRKLRVDNNKFMADRPPFCVLTEKDNRIIRLEYYQGHDSLKLVYDIRNHELMNKELPNFLDKDENGYNPSEFLEKVFGISKDITKPILDKLHGNEDK